MLRLRIVRSPLKLEENEAILRDYNRLTSSRIPLAEFQRWIEDSPAGPAWHAILENGECRIVGHTSLIPLRASGDDPSFIPAKSEYSFVHEDFRSTPIQGFENVKRAKFLILVDQLFQHGLAQGWGPFFVSTAAPNYPLSRRVGCRPIELPLWECLFVLRPASAAKHTVSLSLKQRATLLVVGGLQRTMGSLASLILRHSEEIQTVPIGTELSHPSSTRITLFEDQPSLQWRYPEGQYVRLGFRSKPGSYVIVKRGSRDKYLRICQWELDGFKEITPLLFILLKLAETDKAVGIRWAIYEENENSEKLVGSLRKAGFLCAPRIRTMMVRTKSPDFLNRERWKVNDSFFTFDP